MFVLQIVAIFEHRQKSDFVIVIDNRFDPDQPFRDKHERLHYFDPLSLNIIWHQKIWKF